MQDWEVCARNNLVTVTIPKVFLNQSDESKETARELTAKSAIAEAEAEAEAEVEAEVALVWLRESPAPCYGSPRERFSRCRNVGR